MKIVKSLMVSTIMVSMLATGCAQESKQSDENWLDPKLKDVKVEAPAMIQFKQTYQDPQVIDKSMQTPRGLGYDARQDALYIADPKSSKVMKWQHGKLETFLTSGSGKENVATPVTVRVDSQGRLWVLDGAASMVKVFDENGKYQFGITLDEKSLITTMGIDDQEHAYVGFKDHVVKYDADGKRAHVFAEPMVSSITMYNDMVYFLRNEAIVKDQAGNEEKFDNGFVKYSLDGSGKQELPAPERSGIGQLVVNPVDNQLYAWDVDKRLIQLDSEGNILTTHYDYFGGNKYEVRFRSEFGLAMVFDKNGSIYTTKEVQGELIQLLAK
ncbi:hypothetical protein CIG75_20395 [Tumebacillus algifaecis]|uniref:6-bladed beta-propeller n=1 Tax=Tumebacillus algifaecis TaxID=1214604 RepID=A0A223D613_9BACL|nr:hypothetical protein [Tumebacillus algifaecis]ASS77028.1 hypothetical protein CIG75_20395 [Tumebacillus algifaecis]